VIRHRWKVIQAWTWAVMNEGVASAVALRATGSVVELAADPVATLGALVADQAVDFAR
jgi:hypothetical protein